MVQDNYVHAISIPQIYEGYKPETEPDHYHWVHNGDAFIDHSWSFLLSKCIQFVSGNS